VASDKSSDDQTKEVKIIVQRLARRCYHLPGNSWCQDWVQWFLNTHPVIGMCCHHPLHPLVMRDRIVCLLASISFGIAETSIVVLMFYYEGEDMDKLMFTVPNFFGESVGISQGMIALWTLGGAMHSIFDLTIWHITACSCCQTGGCLSICGCWSWMGGRIAFMITIVTIAVAAVVIIEHATITAREETFPDRDGVVENIVLSLVMAYLLQLFLALFIYFPLIGTVMFSGVLGCGRLPLLGGRPREVRQLAEKAQLVQRKRPFIIPVLLP